MKYYDEYNTVIRDELMNGGDGVPVRLENVSVTGGAEVERGMIMSSADGSVFQPVTADNDAKKILVIASEDFNAPSTGGVMSVYTSGSFHTERLKVGSSVTSAEAFKEALRKENIIISSLKEV